MKTIPGGMKYGASVELPDEFMQLFEDWVNEWRSQVSNGTNILDLPEIYKRKMTLEERVYALYAYEAGYLKGRDENLSSEHPNYEPDDGAADRCADGANHKDNEFSAQDVADFCAAKPEDAK